MTDLVDKFLRLELENVNFDHEAHVHVAYDLLSRYSFVDATKIYVDQLVAFTKQIGQSEKFNMTVTYAFLGLIAERRQDFPQADFERFIARNTDLLDSQVLTRWYTHERLNSPYARSVFVLPDSGPPSNPL